MANMLLVGGAGFTGRHILQAWLTRPGNRATVLDKGVSAAGFANVQKWAQSGRVQVIQDDSRDRTRLDDILRGDSFDSIIQLSTGHQPGPPEFARREALDSMARGTQYLVEAIADHCPDTPMYQLVSTAPWGDDPSRKVDHGVSVRPASLMGVAESIAMEVGLGLSRELGVKNQVFVAPLAFGPHQLEGPVAQFVASVLSGDGATQAHAKANWRLIYAPDLGQRVVEAIENPMGGSVLRLPGLHGIGWSQLSQTLAQLLQRFSAANPALKTRFPQANWTWRVGLEVAQHPGWPEQVQGGAGAIEFPETPWPSALADTLRWYLSHPEGWQGKIATNQELERRYAPAI